MNSNDSLTYLSKLFLIKKDPRALLEYSINSVTMLHNHIPIYVIMFIERDVYDFHEF